MHHGLTKHMKLKWNWVRRMVKSKEVELVFVRTKQQVADFLTKRLPVEDHWRCAKISGLALM